MEPIASQSTEMRIYNFDSSDKVLGIDDQIGKSVENYGCRQIIGHRGDFHLIMKDFALEQGVKIRLGERVEVYDPSQPSITLSSGEIIQSDVVIIADGVRSKGRTTVLGYEDKPQASGYAIYRSFMSGDLLRDDPLTNVGDVAESWTKEATKDDVLACLEGWDPAVRRVWEKMPSVIDWKLVYRPCLDKWVADSGLITLMGDAAHPFLPTSTQGASQAIEDGATIAKCLSKCAGNIPLALHTYFEIRHDYVAEAQATGIKQREIWHNLHDEDSKAFKKEFDINATMMQNLYLWKNDAEKLVDEKWDEVSEIVKQRLSVNSG
ncbi:monooxygenase [Colletotrichum abscissum]|uniref:Monooxygenase n=1 Tax=Colletotrichum abscissum TaxID=1671311 RepID=A0A9P9X3B4_9PEZI|nr:monooxygenase [Colletotrichum abscissum]KAI3533717.1 monooxygenase [Colletotrichum abscissum]KAK1489581.1 monooxygenase [Colletotrichum abscissum]